MNAASPAMIQSLATVRDAVRTALQSAAAALAASGADATAATAAVAEAQRHWRPAHAAMQMVNHPALLQFSNELGALIPVAGAAAVFAQAAGAQVAFMNTLVAGQRDQPMSLWPTYEAMQRARGVEHPNQAELFYPGVSAGPGDNPAAKALNAEELRGARRVFEAGLLQWLRKGDIAGLKQVAAAVRRIEGSLSTGADRQLWWIARGVLEAVQQSALEADAPVRRLATQLNLQLGRLVQGPAPVAGNLLRDALFLAARAVPQANTPLLAEVRRVYALDGALDATAARPVGGFNAEALAAARQRADGLQTLWSNCAAGAGAFAEFEQRARALAGACEPLGVPPLTALVAQLADAAQRLAQPGASLHDATALEVACALLMIEPVLAADHAPEAAFAERARHMAARVKVSLEAPQALADMPPAELLDAQAKQQQTAQYAALVHTEVARALQDIELTLDGWFRDTSAPTAISGLDKPFRQAAGALSVLGHAEAAALAEQCRADVAQYARGAACDETEQRALAGRLAALSAFVEAAKLGPATLLVPGRAAPAIAAKPVVELQSLNLMLEPVALAVATPVIAEAPLLAVVATPVAAPASQETIWVDSAGDTDAEMLDIFLEEASEVLGTIADTAPQSRAQPQDQELLTTLRRAFHTLKGSGRMVGLKHTGEAAYAMEQVFNDMSPTQRPGTPDLYRLVDYAHGAFTRWIGELREHQQAQVNSSQLIDFAGKFREGIALPAALADTVAAPVVSPDVPPLAAPAEQPVSDTLQIGGITISRSLYDIMLPEARQNAAVLE